MPLATFTESIQAGEAVRGRSDFPSQYQLNWCLSVMTEQIVLGYLEEATLFRTTSATAYLPARLSERASKYIFWAKQYSSSAFVCRGSNMSSMRSIFILFSIILTFLWFVKIYFYLVYTVVHLLGLINGLREGERTAHHYS